VKMLLKPNNYINKNISFRA